MKVFPAHCDDNHLLGPLDPPPVFRTAPEDTLNIQRGNGSLKHRRHALLPSHQSSERRRSRVAAVCSHLTAPDVFQPHRVRGHVDFFVSGICVEASLPASRDHIVSICTRDCHFGRFSDKIRNRQTPESIRIMMQSTAGKMAQVSALSSTSSTKKQSRVQGGPEGTVRIPSATTVMMTTGLITSLR